MLVVIAQIFASLLVMLNLAFQSPVVSEASCSRVLQEGGALLIIGIKFGFVAPLDDCHSSSAISLYLCCLVNAYLHSSNIHKIYRYDKIYIDFSV